MKDGVNKKCLECKEYLPVEMFGLNNATKDKLAYRCKPCSLVRDEKYRRSKGMKRVVPREIINGKKICSLCLTNTPIEDFNKNCSTTDGLQTHCRTCSNKKSREYDTCPRRRRNRKLKSNFGITNEDYDRMLLEQDNGCAICGSKDTKHSRNTHFDVDHCHKHEDETGEIKVRGLLCSPCNNGLGRFEDDPDRMRAAIAYLEKANEI